MKHLINREDYINEYLRINNIETNNELYEGLLSTLFGGIKMLLKRDWSGINCKNPTVLSYLKEMDKSLGGYTYTKMQYSSECNVIRQNLADYFNDILEYKLSQVDREDNPDKYLEKDDIEEDDYKETSVAKLLNLRDDTLLDSIKKYKENISTACKKSGKLKEYADQMLNSVVVFVNNIIIQELEKRGANKEKLEKKKKKLEEKQKKLDEERKKKDEDAKKAYEDDIKKLSKQRDEDMRVLDVKPIGSMDGDKAVVTIATQFNNMLGELKSVNESKLSGDYEDLLKSDTYIGILKSIEELNWKLDNVEDKDKEEVFYNKFVIRIILNKINNTFKDISNDKDEFKGIPSASVQAMMVSLSNVIIYGFAGDAFNIEKNDARLSLITKCVIDSDATIGFNLPLIDNKKPDNGNYFVSVMNKLKDAEINAEEVENATNKMTERELNNIKSVFKKNGENGEKEVKEYKTIKDFAKSFGSDIMKQFRQNISNLFDMVVKKANEIKEEVAKKREDEVNKA